MYTYIHVYMYTCIHIYIYTCIHVYVYTCIHIYIYTYRQTDRQTDRHTVTRTAASTVTSRKQARRITTRRLCAGDTFSKVSISWLCIVNMLGHRGFRMWRTLSMRLCPTAVSLRLKHILKSQRIVTLYSEYARAQTFENVSTWPCALEAHSHKSAYSDFV